MISLRIVRVCVILLLAVLSVAGSAAAGETRVSKGHELFLQHCAACHGSKADGHGPLADQLSPRPADLRQLSKKYGNPLREDQIARFMDGRSEVAAHGSREMPVWGEEMWQNPEAKEKPNQVSDSVADIIRYLQSIQIAEPHASLESSLRR